jgi:antitoxin YefM
MEVSVNLFRANLKHLVDKAIDEHRIIRVNRRHGKDFVVISAEDYERDQETLYVLRNSSLMSQVAESLHSYNSGSGYKPTQEQVSEINRI